MREVGGGREKNRETEEGKRMHSKFKIRNDERRRGTNKGREERNKGRKGERSCVSGCIEKVSAPQGWWTAPLMGCCTTDTQEDLPQQEVKEKRLDFQSSL